jgi:proteasome lid subunit RPN8/RPN11
MLRAAQRQGLFDYVGSPPAQRRGTSRGALFASPEDLFAAMRRIREADQRLLGIYHSHPRTSAYPSSADVEMAFYPEAFYFIISLESSPDLRAFKIEGARIEDIEVSVVAGH